MTDDLVFKALADPTRRHLLDLLFVRDGRTLLDLEGAVQMTRFGVMKHLRVLEASGLVVTRRSGREKLHFLNPVPVRLIHDRWIGKYTLRPVAALTGLKAALEREMTETTIKVFEIYIKAPAEKVWEAITQPEWSQKYGYRGIIELKAEPGGTYLQRGNEGMRAMGLPEVIIDGEVIEADPPNRLVHTFRFLFTEAQKAEGFTRVTWEIEATAGGFTRLTVTHDVTGAPDMAAAISSRFSMQGSGGWNWILSDLKSLLETGKTLSAA